MEFNNDGQYIRLTNEEFRDEIDYAIEYRLDTNIDSLIKYEITRRKFKREWIQELRRLEN